MPETQLPTLKAKDYASDQDVRWCPGCGDYAILNQIKKVMASLQSPPEQTVFVSGIGCSSRFPYYMNTYGFHTIHGRAPAFATGIKVANPDLNVWQVTGDGDGLSIGGNHLLHVLRRNVNVKIMLFNNEIYGLTKGQYSPTSPEGKKTKTSPMGSIDLPLTPLSVALAAEASFVARTVDVDRNLPAILERAAHHKGSAFIEILQDCNIFNHNKLCGGCFCGLGNVVSYSTGENIIFSVLHNLCRLIGGKTAQLVCVCLKVTPFIYLASH